MQSIAKGIDAHGDKKKRTGYKEEAENSLRYNVGRRSAVVKRVEHFDNCVSQHLSGAGSSPAGSVGRDLNLQKTQLSMLNH